MLKHSGPSLQISALMILCARQFVFLFCGASLIKWLAAARAAMQRQETVETIFGATSLFPEASINTAASLPYVVMRKARQHFYNGLTEEGKK